METSLFEYYALYQQTIAMNEAFLLHSEEVKGIKGEKRQKGQSKGIWTIVSSKM